VAGAAVLVALGGVGGAVAANTVGSADIKDGAVRTVDLHDQAVTGAKLDPRVLDRDRHHLEADGAYPGLLQLQQGQNSTALWAGDSGGTLQTSWVRCARGKSATGGGFGQNDGALSAIKSLQIVSSVPATIKQGVVVDTAIPGDPDGSIRPNGWVVEGFNNGTTALSVRPWVVCAVMR
jgi:hypothetical protein